MSLSATDQRPISATNQHPLFATDQCPYSKTLSGKTPPPAPSAAYAKRAREIQAEEGPAASKNLSSFHSDSASPFTSFQCLIGAQGAMDRVVSEEVTLKKLLMAYQVTQEDYFVQAGFDENLLNSGGGHLEVIYVHLAKEVDVESSGMLDGLATLFHPFPCVLLTLVDLYRTPTPPDFPLGLDSVILGRGNEQHQILKWTNHSEGQRAPDPAANRGSTPRGGGRRQNGGSAGDDGESGGNRNENNNTPPNQGSGGAGNPPNDEDNQQPSDRWAQTSVVEAKGETDTPEVTFLSCLDVNIPLSVPSISSGEESSSNLDTLFQKFTTRAVVAVDAPHNTSVSLKFKDLGFYTVEHAALEHRYENSKISVKVDSLDEDVYVRHWLPRSTTATGRTITETYGREATSGASLVMGPNISATANISRNGIHTQENTKYLSRITAIPEHTSVEWSYYIDDTYQQQGGLELDHDSLPSLSWVAATPAKKCLRLELSGYWVTRVTPKKWLFSALKNLKRPTVPLLRNFRHLTYIMLPHHLPTSGLLKLQLKAHLPCPRVESVVEKSEKLGVEMEGKVEDLDS